MQNKAGSRAGPEEFRGEVSTARGKLHVLAIFFQITAEWNSNRAELRKQEYSVAAVPPSPSPGISPAGHA